MKRFIAILTYEVKHFMRSPFKMASFLLFLISAVYGLQNGLELLKKQQHEVAEMKRTHEENIEQALSWFAAGKIGPEDKPWVDVTHPMYAMSFAHASAFKSPSPMMPFSIGQAEQFGYYKQVTHRSSTLDADLAEEIANPERLVVGTLDFGFVVLYLFPVLAIILLFNIGGLERDLGFDKLMEVNHAGPGKWLLSRFSFYFLLIVVALLLVMLAYASVSNALMATTGAFVRLFFLIIVYVLIWFVAFYYINLRGNGSASQAIRMVTVWLLFCIVIPGSVHQLAALQHPSDYMTKYLDASRDQMYKTYDLPLDSIEHRLLKIYPELAGTLNASDTASENRLTRSSIYGIVNVQVKAVAQEIEASSAAKNSFIRNSYFINPVSFFQNSVNSICQTDYYAYSAFKSDIQKNIDKKTRLLLRDTWNKETIDKDRFLKYVEAFR